MTRLRSFLYHPETYAYLAMGFIAWVVFVIGAPRF